MRLVCVLRQIALIPAGNGPETLCPLTIPLLWPSRLPCVRTPWPPLAPCTPPPAPGSAPSAVHMGLHRTRAWSEAASPGSWDTKGGEWCSDSQRVLEREINWATVQKERMHREEKGRKKHMKKRKGGTKRKKRWWLGMVLEKMETRGRPGREKEKRKGHQEWDKESEGSDWKRFRDMSPSFKSYSMTNKLPLSLPPSHARLTASWLPWWGGLPIATGGGVVPWDWQWRQLASDCPSVGPSPCVKLGLWIARWSSPQLKWSVCLFVVVLVYVSGPESGDDPRISVEMTKWTGQRQKQCWSGWRSFSLRSFLNNLWINNNLMLQLLYWVCTQSTQE